MNDQANPFNDSETRIALRALLQQKHVHEADTVAVEELGICRGKARIDLAVVNGELHGYEIKSERDSLRRLPGQVEFYGRVVDRATLVVGRRLVSSALEVLPQWWGVLEIRPSARGCSFKCVRQGKRNPSQDPRALVELLWLDIAMAHLEQRGAAKGVRCKPRQLVWDRFCQAFSPEEVGTLVRLHLKARVASSSPAQPS